MSGFAEDALPEGWEALSRADALALGPPEGAKERVRLHLAATLGLAAGLGAAGAVATSAAAGSAGSLPTEGLLGGLAKVLLFKKAVVVCVLAATALTGGTAAYVQVRARSKQAAQPLSLPKERAAPVPHVAQAPGVPAPVAPMEEPAGAPKETLGEERLLLDDAQRAIAQGRLREAQELLERHAQLFPEGRLSEEREALFVRLLVREGRTTEAARRAARFKKEHPHSIQQPGIDQALRGHK
jgi:hypothetical protein